MSTNESGTKQQDNWGAEEWRQPEPLVNDIVLYAECGRIARKVDYRSHSFKLVKPEFGPFTLLVRHGGGDERIELGYGHRGIEQIFSKLDSDERYLLMYELRELYAVGRSEGRKQASAEYREAFADDRLKKRKCPRRGLKIWIEPKRIAQEAR